MEWNPPGTRVSGTGGVGEKLLSAATVPPGELPAPRMSPGGGVGV